MRRIYKLIDEAAWEAARAKGVFTGSAVDHADGFIHFSTADQAAETARRHFAGQDHLMLLTIDAEVLGAPLRWESSRGGALFPHLYAPLRIDAVVEERKLELDPHGIPLLGAIEP